MLRNLLLSLMFAGPLSAQTPSTDVAIGVFPFLVGNMDSRIGEIVTNCQTHGIDTVYVSTFRATGPSTGDLWITDSAGNWNAAWGAVRAGGAGIHLQNLISACHVANIRVVAVLKCFADTVQPDNAAHKQYLLDVIGYLVDSFRANGQPVYDFDGLALDYVRYVGGTNVNAANVTNFVASVRQRIGSLSLHAYLIANRYTFDGPVYNSQFASYATVIAGLASQFGQHWEQLAPFVDVMMPMAYSANGSIYSTNAGHQAYVQQTAAYARTACQLAGYPTRRVCPTIKTYTGEGETTTTQTIDAGIRGALLGGGDGYQSFRYQLLVTNPTWWGPMALYAVPGCNWPEPSFAVTPQRLTALVDPSASRDNDEPATALQVRFDFDSDRIFDTAWQPNASTQGLARHPGTWVSTLQVRDATGHVSTTRRRFAAGSAVTVSPAYFGAASGGSVQVHLDVGPAGAGHVYLALATLSGTAPGFLWRPGFPVPLNIDFLTTSLAGNPNGGFLQNGLGLFDAAGQAVATLTVPPQVAVPFAWSTVHWNFLGMGPFGGASCIGDSRQMIILP